MFRDSYYRRTIIILTVSELGASLYYIATNYSLFEIGFDYPTNMIATGFVELLSFISLRTDQIIEISLSARFHARKDY